MLRKFLTVAVLALCVFHTGLAITYAVEVPTMEEKNGDIKRSDLELGWVASIYAFSHGNKVVDFPPAAMGSFKVEKSGAMVNDYTTPLGFPIKNKSIGWKGDAYIVAEKKGYYVFMINTTGRHYSYTSIAVNGRQLAHGIDSESTIVGNVELEAGIHAVDFRFVNVTRSNGLAEGSVRNNCGFEVRIKGPDDNAPVHASKVLYRKK